MPTYFSSVFYYCFWEFIPRKKAHSEKEYGIDIVLGEKFDDFGI